MRRRNWPLAALLIATILPPFHPAGISATDASDNNKDVPTWVRAKVDSMQPTPEDRKFDEIGWVNSIVDAEKLARQNNRPVFLFTQNGRIEIGRT